MSAPEVVAARGDTALAERIVVELGVAPDAAAAVDAGWAAYLRHLVGSVIRAVGGGLVRLVEAIPLPPGWPRVLAIVVAVAAVVLVAVVVARMVRQRRRAGKPAAAAGPDVVTSEPGGPPAAERDATAWRAELEALLAAGRVAEAVRAAWWWLARALAGGEADPAWTGRELLEHAGRGDLLPAVRHLERLTYGRGRPAAGELRSLVAELEGTVP